MAATKKNERTRPLGSSDNSMGNIGKYRLVEKLGKGGFGAVYKALDPDLDVPRALKVPFEQTEEIDAQLNEARLQAKISHLNMVQVHSVEKIDGKWVIVMDYVDGGSLRDKLESSGSLSVDEAVKYAIQLAGALREAHANKILHHDIKPENVLFNSEGIPKIADFGVARVMRTSKKEMSKVMGTVSYMAPEQLDGKADFRSDIWSLGVMFFEMLTGERCFTGDSQPEIIKKIIMDRPRPITEVNPTIPRSLASIVMQMLETNPDKRYQNMGDVVKDLQVFLSGTTVEKRKPVRWLVPLLVGVLLVVSGAIYGAHTGIFKADMLSLFDAPAESVPSIEFPEDVLTLPLEKKMEASSDAIDKGDFPVAYHLLDQVMESAEDPDMKARASYIKATVALQYMDLPEIALADYKQLIESYPESPYVGDAHYCAGLIYYEKKNDLKNAIQHLTTVAEQYPESSEAQAAEILIHDAAKQLAKEGTNVGLVAKSFIGGFLPNNVLSLIISLLSFISFIVGPIAWILTQYHKPELDTSGGVSSRRLFSTALKTRGLKTLLIIFLLSQIISFIITHYQSNQDFDSMVEAIRASGVVVKVAE